MARNLRVFSSVTDYNEAELVRPSVSYIIETDNLHYDDVPTTFQGKWLATYDGGTTTSAECDAYSAITYNEITKKELISVEIGDCVTRINSNAFNNCSSLTSITIPDSVTNIGEYAFEYCSGLTSIDIGSGVTIIGSGAFMRCSGLTRFNSDVDGVLNIPDNVTIINFSTFAWCGGFTSLSIGSGLTSINNGVFSDCTGLTSVTIPTNVTDIGYMAFMRCSSLESITVEATTPPRLGSNVFDDTNNCPIYVPRNSVNAYKTASNWSTYASRIQAIQ